MSITGFVIFVNLSFYYRYLQFDHAIFHCKLLHHCFATQPLFLRSNAFKEALLFNYSNHFSCAFLVNYYPRAFPCVFLHIIIFIMVKMMILEAVASPFCFRRILFQIASGCGFASFVFSLQSLLKFRN